MFYNFNRHKKEAAHRANPQTDELAAKIARQCQAAQRKIADRINKKVSKLTIRCQRVIFLILLTSGTAYCIYLTLPNAHEKMISEFLQDSTGKSQTIQAAAPSPMQQAFLNYLDSLESAFIADSIYQSQQNILSDAKQITQP